MNRWHFNILFDSIWFVLFFIVLLKYLVGFTFHIGFYDGLLMLIEFQILPVLIKFILKN